MTRTTAILPPRFMGSTAWYAAMASHSRVIVDTAVRYDKRCKAVHRCDIVDTRGPVSLTVPLAKPHTDGRPTWRHAAVSTHDEWWRRHRVTLESAYGRTPFFEFLIDKFDGVLRSPADWDSWPSAIDIDCLADSVIRGILELDCEVEWRDAADIDTCRPDVADLRRAALDIPAPEPYWQVRADKLGFRPGLSVLDLIFNTGKEAALWMARQEVAGI